MVFGAIGGWFALKFQVKRLEDWHIEQDEKIKNIVGWSHTYEKEAAQRRLEFEIKIAKQEGNMGVLNQKLDSISERLDELITEIKK